MKGVLPLIRCIGVLGGEYGVLDGLISTHR